MAKKAELLEEAKKLKLDVTEKNTIAQIETAMKAVTEKLVAKAGKRSEKGLKEAEDKQTKINRQKSLRLQTSEEVSVRKKKPVKPARSRSERRGKKYRKSAELIEKNKAYSLKDAVELAIKTSQVKFDASLEIHIRLGVDPKQADQNIRDSVVLPAGSGKTVRVAVFAEEDNAKKAIKAGADFAGEDELLAKLDKNNIDFDVLVATPSLMAKLAKYARILGPKGLMPNPKSGTVTNDVAKAVKQSKAGKIEYRVDSTGIIHVSAGKISLGPDKLEQNARAVLDSIRHNEPSGLKGNYGLSLTVTTTMGPGIKVQLSELG